MRSLPSWNGLPSTLSHRPTRKRSGSEVSRASPIVELAAGDLHRDDRQRGAAGEALLARVEQGQEVGAVAVGAEEGRAAPRPAAWRGGRRRRAGRRRRTPRRAPSASIVPTPTAESLTSPSSSCAVSRWTLASSTALTRRAQGRDVDRLVGEQGGVVAVDGRPGVDGDLGGAWSGGRARCRGGVRPRRARRRPAPGSRCRRRCPASRPAPRRRACGRSRWRSPRPRCRRCQRRLGGLEVGLGRLGVAGRLEERDGEQGEADHAAGRGAR